MSAALVDGMGVPLLGAMLKKLLWALGYPEAALEDTERAVKDAREIGQAATLMYALCHATFTHILRGNIPDWRLWAMALNRFAIVARCGSS